ncbi:GNAT family N-acetyltransferase [uncultured Phenylobacterium sp.]|uniref:GNAT family N-acetyltransferase n=1 Tax=uncultured Phenylobacterium sp. TaxID=349273 RepID=UPI002600951B|nr:GNAT family N-acetyltransferase [uncultured Phenylobacterium sp.]
MSPVEFYIPFQSDGLVLVAEANGVLAGFSACQACADALHLWELAVRHDAQGQGIGRGLVAATFALARARDLPAVTLSTFREIPWNAPFYARMGFRELTELNPRLGVIHLREELLGLPVARRVFMRAEV